MSSEKRFSDLALKELKKAGWFPGRDMHDLAQKWIRQLSGFEQFKLFDHIEKILKEFGGLFFNVTGEGIDRYKDPFLISPEYAIVEDLSLEEILEYMPEEVGLVIYPIGMFTKNDLFIVTDEKERVLLINDDFVHLANSFDEALENLLTGRDTIHKLSLAKILFERQSRTPKKKDRRRVPFSD